MHPSAAFAPTPGTIHLDTATFGLPPIATVTAMREALDAWQAGRADWMEDWDRPAESCRTAFASLASVDSEGVALLPAASVGVGLVAAGLGPGDEVVVPENEFTSVLFPLLLARERGVAVREVPFASLADSVRPSTTLVCFSLVQMQTGLRADLTAILHRAREVGGQVLIDATQAIPFLDPGEDLGAADVVVCSAYKHLLCPRGVCFMYLGSEARRRLQPLLANWRAADKPYARYFGGPLTLADSAARFDVSLAWLPWVGATRSLALLTGWQADGALEAVRAAADRLAAGLGLGRPPSTLVCAPVADPDRARQALQAVGVRAAVRGTAVRLAPHVYSTDADLDVAISTLSPLLGR